VKQKIHAPTLVNAAAMARAHPTTFQRPTVRQLDSICPGNIVKVCDNWERFWVIVTRRDDDGFIVGKVDNFLVQKKAYNRGALVRFGAENVYEILVGEKQNPNG